MNFSYLFLSPAINLARTAVALNGIPTKKTVNTSCSYNQRKKKKTAADLIHIELVAFLEICVIPMKMSFNFHALVSLEIFFSIRFSI